MHANYSIVKSFSQYRNNGGNFSLLLGRLSIDRENNLQQYLFILFIANTSRFFIKILYKETKITHNI